MSSDINDLMGAVKHNNLEIVKNALANGVDPDANNSAYHVLHIAIENGNDEIAELLIEGGASLNVRDYMMRTPLLLAIEKRNQRIASSLINAGADVNIADSDQTKPIHLAAEKGLAQMVKILIEKGASVNSLDGSKATPLIRAAGAGHELVVRYLINGGADREVQPQGFSARTIANSRGFHNIARLLESDDERQHTSKRDWSR